MLKRILFVLLLVCIAGYGVMQFDEYIKPTEIYSFNEGTYVIDLPGTPVGHIDPYEKGVFSQYWLITREDSYGMMRTTLDEPLDQEGMYEVTYEDMLILDELNYQNPDLFSLTSSTRTTFGTYQARIDDAENSTTKVRYIVFTDGFRTQFILAYSAEKASFNEAVWSNFISTFKVVN